MATITVLPNQSMVDVIIQAMGSMEGGMAFCALNSISISDTPTVGAAYNIPDESASGATSTTNAAIAFDSDTMTDNGVLQYFIQNDVVIGNLGNLDGVFVTEDGVEDFETEDGGEHFVRE